VTWIFQAPRPVRLLTPRREDILRDRVLQAKFRRQVLKRDGYRCTNCGRTEEEIEKYEQPGFNVLEAAHIKSKKFFGGDEVEYFNPNNGRALCRRCHLLFPKEEL